MAKEEEAPKKVSRRQFVKGAAVGGAGVAAAGVLASCAPAAAPTTAPEAAPTCPPAEECPPCALPGVPETWDEEADMLIIGTGHAGQMAAIEAYDQGAKVLLVEMAPSPYFAESSCCGASASVPGSPFQIEEGILDDSPDLLYEDMMRVGLYSNRTDVLRLFVDNVLEAFTRFWELGAELQSLAFTGGHSKKRNHKHINRQCSEALQAQIDDRGITTLFNTRATRLVVDPTTGRMLGVEAMKGVAYSPDDQDYVGGDKVYLKGKVTVLATGGMCGNPEMLARYVPRVKALAAWAEPGPPGTSRIPEGELARPLGFGDGYIMGMDIGADTTHMYCITLYQGTPVGSEAPEFGRSGVPRWVAYPDDTYRGAIAVNKEGKRFVDEYKAPCEIGEAMVLQTDKTHFLIADAVQYEGALANPGLSTLTPDIVKLIEEGEIPVWYGDTIEELATNAGIDPAGLKETVANWNSYVDEGKDPELGRSFEPPRLAHKIETPPFVVTQHWIAPLHNGGGLKANTSLQILDVHGNVIPGLYGAGEIIGGTAGEVYLSTTHWPVAVTFGYLVGKKFAIEEALA